LKGRVILSAKLGGRRRRPQTTAGIRKLEGQPFYVVSKYRHVCDGRTDRQTDRITTAKTALALLRRAVLKTDCLGAICSVLWEVIDLFRRTDNFTIFYKKHFVTSS